MSEQPDPSTQPKGTAARFARVRRDHALELAEDYAEMVLELGGLDRAPVRPADLARSMGVSHVSVLRALGRLARNGYVLRDPDGGVLLSAEGQSLGETSRARHRLIVAFLESLGVPREVAAVDAEGLEHHLSPVTLERMAEHLTSR